MFHLHSIHQDALKLFSSHLEFIFGPQSSPQMVSVCSETNCSSSSFCQTITLCQSLRICTSFHPSPRQPLGPSVSLSPSSRNKVPKHQQRMSVSCTHHQSKEQMVCTILVPLTIVSNKHVSKSKRYLDYIVFWCLCVWLDLIGSSFSNNILIVIF